MATASSVSTPAGVVPPSGGGVYPLNAMQRSWVRVALSNQRAVISRGRLKEREGSEVYLIRGREIAELDLLAELFAS